MLKSGWGDINHANKFDEPAPVKPGKYQITKLLVQFFFKPRLILLNHVTRLSEKQI